MSSINKVATLHIGLKLPRTEQPHRAVVTLYACKNGKIFSRPGKGTDGNLLFLCLLCAVGFPAGRAGSRVGPPWRAPEMGIYASAVEHADSCLNFDIAQQ